MFDQLTINVISAVINGTCLLIGIYLGEKLTSKAIQKIIMKTIDDSLLLKKLAELVNIMNNLLSNEKTINEITGFFTEARELVTSPEAKNFFKNASQALQDFTGENKTKLNLPKKGGEK